LSKLLTLDLLERQTVDGHIETLKFTRGVNVIVGQPNAGKTVWLKMLDYLMGDTSKVEEAFGDETESGVSLTEKYESITGVFFIGETKLVMKRTWHEDGFKTKIVINDEEITANSFSQFLLHSLDIPILHFPKGNPYSEKSWPELSWRMMMRHIYRQERFWSDIADKQPDSEQHAVLAQFLGLAERFYPQQLGFTVEKRKKLAKLEAEREQFERVLDKITKDLSSFDNIITFATPESISNAIQSLEHKIDDLLVKRKQIIERASIEVKNDELSDFSMLLLNKKNQISSSLQNISKIKSETLKRITNFKNLSKSITNEIDKLDRTKTSGEILANLQITHCPACDQEISSKENLNEEVCFLCHQPMIANNNMDRIDFEMAQLNSEFDELQEILKQLENELSEYDKEESDLIENQTLIDRQLRPMQEMVSALINNEVATLDSSRGRFEEQIEMYKRIQKQLEYKNELLRKIELLNSEISVFDLDIDALIDSSSIEQACSDIEENIANYMNRLNYKGHNRWKSGRVKLTMNETYSLFKINNAKWSSVGATTKALFLFSYHYGLLALSGRNGYHYPGWLVIDFPPQLADTDINLYDAENYLLEPFIELCNKNEQLQVIIAGRAFEKLNDVNEIQLTTVWK
jgi:hypothetical protein